MGDTKPFPKCMRFIAAFSRYPELLEWCWSRVESSIAPILLKSPAFAFLESEYYSKTMGSDLLKQFAVLDTGYDPAQLAADKLEANLWEVEAHLMRSVDVARPLNIDPGYMGLTKLVLASTKNREHRIYLRDGIYAEVTLAFRDQMWQPMPWTYPDYQRADFGLFFAEARKLLLH
jgi:hypothetical protein